MESGTLLDGELSKVGCKLTVESGPVICYLLTVNESNLYNNVSTTAQSPHYLIWWKDRKCQDQLPRSTVCRPFSSRQPTTNLRRCRGYRAKSPPRDAVASSSRRRGSRRDKVRRGRCSPRCRCRRFTSPRRQDDRSGEDVMTRNRRLTRDSSRYPKQHLARSVTQHRPRRSVPLFRPAGWSDNEDEAPDRFTSLRERPGIFEQWREAWEAGVESSDDDGLGAWPVTGGRDLSPSSGSVSGSDDDERPPQQGRHPRRTRTSSHIASRFTLRGFRRSSNGPRRWATNNSLPSSAGCLTQLATLNDGLRVLFGEFVCYGRCNKTGR